MLSKDLSVHKKANFNDFKVLNILTQRVGWI